MAKGSTGTACQLQKSPTVFAGPKRFSKLRNANYYGSESARVALKRHIAKWKDRGMSFEKIGEKLGISWREASALFAEDRKSDTSPKLVKKLTTDM